MNEKDKQVLEEAKLGIKEVEDTELIEWYHHLLTNFETDLKAELLLMARKEIRRRGLTWK